MGTSDDASCVYCRKRPVDVMWRPFCSERCKMADLGRWFGEEYRVPVAEQPPEAEPDDDAPER